MNKRPATFVCAWCEAEKPLARTGRMPKFCSDYCRRQPEAAERALAQAVWQRDHAIRNVAFYSAKLERYRRDVSEGDRAPERFAPRPRTETA